MTWQDWYDKLSRREKFGYQLGKYLNRWDDWLCEKPETGFWVWLSNKDWAYSDAGFLQQFREDVCKLFGHTPTVDHCGLPEHDYCSGCNKLTPHGVPRDENGKVIW